MIALGGLATRLFAQLAVQAITPAPAAEPNDRIAVFGAATENTAMQLQAELELLGFEVLRVEEVPPTTPADLQAVARELDVAAAILVDARPGELELWVVDRVTGKTLIRSVTVGDSDSVGAARIAAVRAIDLLRASLRELEERAPLPEAEVAPSPVVRQVLRPSAPRFGLGFGPMVAGAMGGIGPTAHVLLALQYLPHPRFGIGTRAVAPIAGARVGASEGSARVHIGWLVIGPRFALARPQRTVVPSIGLGIGPAFVGMSGDARPPYAGRRDLVVAALAELDLAVAIAVHPRLRIWLDASAGAVLPRVGLRFGGRRVASWGWVAGTGTIGLQIVL